MRHKSYTILILPKGATRFRELRVSRRAASGIALVVGLLVTGGLVAPHLIVRLQSHRTATTRLQQQNEQLMTERNRFATAVAELEDRLNRFEGQAGRLALQLGRSDLAPPPAGGQSAPGAVTATHPADHELQILANRAERIDRSLTEMDRAFRERMHRLTSTPNGMPVQGWFSHGFGWRKDPWTGEREFHRGIDIVADAGTEILAPADGVVSQTSRKPDYGKMLDVSHGYGFVTRYGHMSEVLVRPGQRVSRGDVLGRVGSTGRSTGPHVHYEVFRDGRRVNPWKYLGQR